MLEVCWLLGSADTRTGALLAGAAAVAAAAAGEGVLEVSAKLWS